MNHYSYYNKGHNLINSCYMQRKGEMLAFYRVLLFVYLLFLFSLGLNRENNAYLSKEKVRSIRNDSLFVNTTL